MASPRPVVLIVADSDNLPYYQNLPMAQEEIVTAGPGEVLCAMVRRDVDLVLLDCGFHPELGLGIVSDLKSRHPRVPVLFANERSSEEVVIRAFHSGVRCYLRKPLDPLELRDLIRQVLKVKGESREQRQGIRVSKASDDYCLWPRSGNPMSEPIMRVLNFVERHFHEPLTLERLAGIACVSPNHFSRTFHREVGMAPLQYVKYLRIQRAKALLRCENLQIFAVAARVGFPDVGSFNRNFRKFEEMTPTQYRQSQTNREHLPAQG